MIDFLTTAWPLVVGALTVLLAVVASAHVVLYKRDSRSAAGWVGVVLVFPILGPVLYALLGINRIKRLATELRQERMRLEATTAELQHQHHQIEEVLRPQDAHLAALAIEHGLILCSTDGDFARFPGLRWENPLHE